MKKGRKMQSWVEKKECVYWVSSSLKIHIQLPLPKPHITSFKDLFDLEGLCHAYISGGQSNQQVYGT